MRIKTKIIIFCVGIILLAGHFLLLFFYTLPFNKSNKITFFSQAYVYPFFHQNWSLFAPIPDSNYQLFAEYESNGIQRTDLFKEVVTKHQTNRLAGYGPLVLLFSNSIHYFEKNACPGRKLDGPISNDNYFRIIEYEAENYLVNYKKIKPQKVKLILIVENAKSKTKRIYFD